MFEITVYCEGHKPFEAKLVPGVYRVGASPACHLQISGSGVAPRHCQLTVGDHSIRVQAFDAANPVYVDGAAVGGEPAEAGPGSEIRLGNVVIKLIGPEGAGMNTAIDLPREEPPKEEARPEPPPARSMENLLKSEQTSGGIAVLRISGVPFDKRELLQEIKKRAHIELIKRLNLKRLAMSGVSEDDLNEKAKSNQSDTV